MAGIGIFDSDLLNWSTPWKTGAVVGSVNVLFFTVVFLDVWSFFCTCGMLAILIGGVIKFMVPQLHEKKLELLSKDAITAIVEVIAQALNTATEQVQHKVLWTRSESTIKALVVLEVCRRIAPWVSMSFILFVIVNAMFFLPLLEAPKRVFMAKHGNQIDNLLKLKDNLLAKVPRYVDEKDD